MSGYVQLDENRLDEYQSEKTELKIHKYTYYNKWTQKKEGHGHKISNEMRTECLMSNNYEVSATIIISTFLIALNFPFNS